MTDELTNRINSFLALSAKCGEPLTDYSFGFKAVKNGRLLERLRSGGDVTRRTEKRVSEFIEQNTKRLSQIQTNENCGTGNSLTTNT